MSPRRSRSDLIRDSQAYAVMKKSFERSTADFSVFERRKFLESYLETAGSWDAADGLDIEQELIDADLLACFDLLIELNPAVMPVTFQNPIRELLVQ
jgi:hypothetical protein